MKVFFSGWKKCKKREFDIVVKLLKNLSIKLIHWFPLSFFIHSIIFRYFVLKSTVVFKSNLTYNKWNMWWQLWWHHMLSWNLLLWHVRKWILLWNISERNWHPLNWNFAWFCWFIIVVIIVSAKKLGNFFFLVALNTLDFTYNLNLNFLQFWLLLFDHKI